MITTSPVYAERIKNSKKFVPTAIIYLLYINIYVCILSLTKVGVGVGNEDLLVLLRLAQAVSCYELNGCLEGCTTVYIHRRIFYLLVE